MVRGGEHGDERLDYGGDGEGGAGLGRRPGELAHLPRSRVAAGRGPAPARALLAAVVRVGARARDRTGTRRRDRVRDLAHRYLFFSSLRRSFFDCFAAERGAAATTSRWWIARAACCLCHCCYNRCKTTDTWKKIYIE